MNITDTGKVLAKIQAFDHRTIGDSEIMVWHECIGDLDVDDCMAAVTIHYRESTEWLTPAHIRRIVADLDRKRRGAQRRAQLAHMRAADGSPLALEANERPVAANKPREVAELIERLAAKLPAVTVEQKA